MTQQRTTIELVRVVSAVVFAVTVIRAADALEVLAVELQVCAVLVDRVTVLVFIRAVTAVVIMVARPTLTKHKLQLAITVVIQIFKSRCMLMLNFRVRDSQKPLLLRFITLYKTIQNILLKTTRDLVRKFCTIILFEQLCRLKMYCNNFISCHFVTVNV